jgi:hypothetical protein
MEHRRWSTDDLVKQSSRAQKYPTAQSRPSCGERPVGNEGESSSCEFRLKLKRKRKLGAQMQL